MNERKLAMVLLVSLGIIGIFAVIACLSMGVWAIWSFTHYEPSTEFTASDYQPVPTDMGKIASLESNAEIKLPPSARRIYSYTTGSQDISIQVRFVIDASELAEFLENTLCRAPLELISIDDLAESSGNPSWWHPEKSQHLETCRGVKDNSSTTSTRQTIYVDMTNPDVYIIYVNTSTD